MAIRRENIFLRQHMGQLDNIRETGSYKGQLDFLIMRHQAKRQPGTRERLNDPSLKDKGNGYIMIQLR